jgi:hypothetical protein
VGGSAHQGSHSQAAGSKSSSGHCILHTLSSASVVIVVIVVSFISFSGFSAWCCFHWLGQGPG